MLFKLSVLAGFLGHLSGKAGLGVGVTTLVMPGRVEVQVPYSASIDTGWWDSSLLLDRGGSSEFPTLPLLMNP